MAVLLDRVRILAPNVVRPGFKVSFYPINFNFFFLFLFFFSFFRATPATYGGSQAWGPIEAIAIWQCQIWAVSATYTTAHSRCRIVNPLSEAKDQTCNLMIPSRIRFCCAKTRTPASEFCRHCSVAFVLPVLFTEEGKAKSGSQPPSLSPFPLQISVPQRSEMSW